MGTKKTKKVDEKLGRLQRSNRWRVEGEDQEGTMGRGRGVGGETAFGEPHVRPPAASRSSENERLFRFDRMEVPREWKLRPATLLNPLNATQKFGFLSMKAN